MAILFKNNAASTLTYKMTDAQEVLYVADASVFPVIASDSGDVFKLTLVGDDTLEIVEAFEVYNPEGRQGFKVRRAQEGTPAQAWPAGTRVEMRITAGALDSFVPTAVQIAKDNVDAIGVASTTNVGFAGVDGQTTQANVDGVVTAKDVAIGGDLGDLASARGQIGDAKEMPNLDFNTLTTPGNYRITGNPTNGPSLPLNISGASVGSLIVAGTLGQNGRIFQIMISGSTVTWRTIQTSTGTWSAWQQLLSGNKVGAGIRVTNGIISVPEMQGATASTAGTSGLVPPAAAGEQESFLTGGGEYKPALTNISDSVSLADSTTAASAKAVKTAYDLANSKQANLGFTPVQQGGGTGQEPDHKVYLGWNSEGLAVQVDSLNLGNIITTKAGKQLAPAAELANKLAVGPSIYSSWLYESIAGQPSYLWGSNDGVNMRVYNPANLSVNYANSAGSVSGLGGARVSGVVSRCGDEICVHAPAGGQYLVLYGQRVAVTNGRMGDELYATLRPGIYAGGSHLGQTGNRENDDAHMVAYAGELYRV